MSNNSVLTIVLPILCLCFSSCGSGNSSQPDLGLVNGTVTFEGQPLSGASVTFQPESGRPATAITNADGTYELIYIRDTAGCKVGHNQVMIATVIEGEDDLEAEGDDAPQVKIKPVKEKVPPKYNTKTELAADVQPGKNTFNFHLTK